MPTIPEPAWKTHPDGEDHAVRQRLEGCKELSAGTLSLAELKASAKAAAEEGSSPDAVVELGLFLGEDEYEALKAYARTLTIVRPKVRRRR